MKELIPMDDYGVFADTHDTVRVDSRFVAECFDKQHFHVLRDIAKITETRSGLSNEVVSWNFKKSTYKDASGKKNIYYQMTRDGFTILVMGYTGAKAMKFKEAYINRFNEMEKFFKAMVEARQEFPLLTENIKLIHENPRPHHFSNEADMLNRLVIGQTAKQFRGAHGLRAGESIRPYLTSEQIKQLDTLQKIDIGLLLAMPDFSQRKRQLQWYLEQTTRKRVGA